MHPCALSVRTLAVRGLSSRGLSSHALAVRAPSVRGLVRVLTGFAATLAVGALAVSPASAAGASSSCDTTGACAAVPLR